MTHSTCIDCGVEVASGLSYCYICAARVIWKYNQNAKPVDKHDVANPIEAHRDGDRKPVMFAAVANKVVV